MTEYLYAKIEYNHKLDTFEVNSNIKEERLEETIETFIRSQFGAGSDDSEPNREVDVFEITVALDLRDDTFHVSSNCGNLGLRDGILLHFLERGCK